MHPIDEFGGPAALLILITALVVTAGAYVLDVVRWRLMGRHFDTAQHRADLYRRASKGRG